MEKQSDNTAQRLKKKRKADFDLAPFYLLHTENGSLKRSRKDCPYLGQIKRHLLDFDSEKQCSVSLSTMNVYSCLACGRYLQGKGKSTQAYIHSLEEAHNVFINLNDSSIWCLPDNYEVEDASLLDIKYNLLPIYNQEMVNRLDSEPIQARALDGTEYLPGLLGLNNLKQTDFMNVMIQSLCRVKPLRDHCLLKQIVSHQKVQNQDQMLMVKSFQELIKKIWNPRNFKGHVSPHEFIQAVSSASSKRFKIGEQKDPIQFISWFLNSFNETLGGSNNIIKDTFQGELELSQLIPKNPADINFLNKIAAMKTNVDTSVQYEMKNQKTKFFFLTLDLPQVPLFKEQNQLATIPQIPLMTLLKKFDGKNFTEEPVTCIKKKYKIKSLPKFLILHCKRFLKNDYFTEKNPTIVNFPIKNLDLQEFLWVDENNSDKNQNYKYDLLANIIHDGKADSGSYRVQVRHKPTDECQ